MFWCCSLNKISVFKLKFVNGFWYVFWMWVIMFEICLKKFIKIIKFFFLLFFIRVIIIVIVLCDFYFYGDDCLKNCVRYVNGSYGRCNVMG